MKKIVGACVCALTLMGLVGQAEAAPLTNWDFTISAVDFTLSEPSVASGGGSSVSWEGGAYEYILNRDPGSGSLTLQGDDEYGYNDPLLSSAGSVAELTTKDLGGFEYNAALSGSLATMSMTFDLTSGTESFSVTYNIPLQFYVTEGGAEYIYYDTTQASFTGTNSTTIDDYIYTIYMPSFSLNGSGLEFVEGLPGVESGGWLIDSAGFFDMTVGFDMSYEAAPTPEPATMLLMGLGLAGLGFVARRRNRK